MNSNFVKLALLAGSFGAACLGQMATGNIGGQVEDSSGAVIANAKVTLVHSATSDCGESNTCTVTPWVAATGAIRL